MRDTVTDHATPYYDEGDVTIYHGDCRDILPHVAADVMVTDPPYGYSHESNWDSKWQGQQIAGDTDTSLRDAALAVWGSRPAAVFGSWKRPRPRATRAVLVWDKGPASGMGDLAIPWKPNWEEIYILGTGFAGRRDSGVLSGYTVVTWSGRGQRVHPNEKPVNLLRDLIGKCPAGVIVDPFMGSGTTLRAAKDLGRRAIGIEVEERYCEIAVQRLRQEVLTL